MDKSKALGETTRLRVVLPLARIQIVAITLLAAESFGQIPEVKSWRTSADDVRTQITITANTDIHPAPILLLECSGKHPSVRIYLITGALKPHPTVGLLNSVSEWLLLTRLDERKPVLLSWVPTKQPGTYSYEGEGKNGMPNERESPAEFLKDLLAARVLDVQFRRRGEREMRVVSFDTTDLKRSFDARRECVTQ